LRYGFIRAHEQVFRMQAMCRVLEVKRSSYYAWRRRAPSRRAQANQALVQRIHQIHRESDQTYGSPRIQLALQHEGERCGRKRIARLMHQERLVGVVRGKYQPQTTQRAAEALPAPNRLNQDFRATAPNQKWVSDFTYLRTAAGWLFLAVILDLFSRKVVGWAMSTQMDQALVQKAWEMAVQTRHPGPGLLHHSDQGRQYTAAEYQAALRAVQAQVSMSRVGNCYDNAVAESFFATLKSECQWSGRASPEQVRGRVFEYIEGWYNRKRLHSALGYHSPVEFERIQDMNCVH
jgi:transposase InsO family protein